MTGVAAALVAQVTNSSLQQEYIPTIHWIVPALWTSTLVFALLSVYYSFLLHHYLGGFASAGDLRKAFTHRNFSSAIARGEEGEGEEGRGLPSLTVAVKVWAPTYLLALAIGSYIGTIGVYWGVAWGMNLQGRGVGSRNVCLTHVHTFFSISGLIIIMNYTGVYILPRYGDTGSMSFRGAKYGREVT